jgi:hypothetical protein
MRGLNHKQKVPLMKNETLALALLSTFASFSNAFGSSEFTDKWDAAKSMTAALHGSCQVIAVESDTSLIGKSGPSPANFSLVAVLKEDLPHVLMCKDYDPRQLQDGSFRPTHGSLKASMGFGLPKGHSFETSYDAMVKGPANTALYNMLSDTDLILKTASFAYLEEGEGWGPAVTIPLILTSQKGHLSSDDVEQWLNTLNERASDAFKNRSSDTSLDGRFRDFTLVPLKALLSTGSDKPAVLQEDKLMRIEHNGVTEKLWDEPQMRQALLPALDTLLAPFYSY